MTILVAPPILHVCELESLPDHSPLDLVRKRCVEFIDDLDALPPGSPAPFPNEVWTEISQYPSLLVVWHTKPDYKGQGFPLNNLVILILKQLFLSPRIMTAFDCIICNDLRAQKASLVVNESAEG